MTRGQRRFDHVGGVEPPSEADLQQHHIRGMARKQQHSRRRRNFEQCQRRPGIDALALRQRRFQFSIRDQPTGKAKALVEAHQMRRRIDMHALAVRFEHRAHEGDHRTFAVGAGDMDHRRQLALGVAELRQDARHPVKREIDQPGMQRLQPRDDVADGSQS